SPIQAPTAEQLLAERVMPVGAGGEGVPENGVDRVRPIPCHVFGQLVVSELLMGICQRLGARVIAAELKVLADLLVHLNLEGVIVRRANARVRGDLSHSLV